MMASAFVDAEVFDTHTQLKFRENQRLQRPESWTECGYIQCDSPNVTTTSGSRVVVTVNFSHALDYPQIQLCIRMH